MYMVHWICFDKQVTQNKNHSNQKQCLIPIYKNIRKILKVNMSISDKGYLFYLHAFLLGSSLIVINIMHSVFSQISANQDGSFPFSESGAVFIAEFAKGCLALGLLLIAFFDAKQNKKMEANHSNMYYFTPSVRLILEMMIPAALYTVSNILSYTAIGLLGSTGYQIFSNAKIIVTALIFRIIVQTPFTVIQWISLFLLLFALLIAKNSNYDFAFKTNDRLVVGFSMVLVLSFASSFAGVYSEVKLKKTNKHPMLQNGILYIWCCIFALLQFYVEHLSYETATFFIFENFSVAVWGAIATSAIYGQIVALIFYYCDNMVKVFANSLTVIVSLIVDHVYFEKDLSIDVCVSGCIVCICTIIYYIDNQILIQYDETLIKNFRAKNCRHVLFTKFLSFFCVLVSLIIVFIHAQSSTLELSQVEIKTISNSTRFEKLIDDSSLATLPQTLTSNKKDSNNHCDWPRPIYKQENKIKNMDVIVQNLDNLKLFFEKNSNFSFSYIDSGQALGIYRGEGFIQSDGDIDIRYAICSDCPQKTKTQTTFPQKIGTISMNNFAEWGDIWTRKTIAFDIDAAYLNSVKSDLCLQNYSGTHSYWVHKNSLQRSAFQFTYGDFWFVRLPWKGLHQVTRWQKFANTKDHTIDMWHDSWRRSLQKINTMDINDDNIISVSELNQYVLRDGIIYDRYMESISEYERCRAAAMLTFLIRFQKMPSNLKHHNKFSSNARLDIFRFPECDKFRK